MKPTSMKPSSPRASNQKTSINGVEEQIRHRAYELYEQRGRQDGHALDDWLRAESEVSKETKTNKAVFS